MKRWIRNTLAVAAIMSGSGILLGVVGYSMGMRSIPMIYSNNDMMEGGMRVATMATTDTMNSESATIDKPLNAFENIDLDIDVGNVTIQTGDDFHVRANNVDKRRLTIKDSAGTLEIDYEYKKSREWPQERDQSFIITIPQQKNLQYMYISGGVGETAINGINAQTFALEGGVGSVEINNSTFSVVEIEGGVCDVLGRNITVSEYTDIQSGVGNVDLEGALSSMDITGGVGNVFVKLRNTTPQEYSYNIQSGMGVVKFDGKTVSTNSNGSGINSNAKYNIDIEGGVGNIEVSFDNTKPAATVEIETAVENVAGATAVQTADSNNSYSGYQNDMSSYLGNDKFTITFESDFKDFSGEYTILEDTITKADTKRKINWEFSDDEGNSTLKWIKPDGSVQVLASNIRGDADGGTAITMGIGKHKIVLSVPKDKVAREIDVEFYSVAR